MKKEAEHLAKEKAEASKKQTDFILSMQQCVQKHRVLDTQG